MALPSRLFSAIALAACLTLRAAPQAYGWGHTGHVLIGEIAASSLPQDVPEFLRGAAGSAMIGEIAAEPDLSRGAGDSGSHLPDIHDAERDPGHYINLDDRGYAAPSAGFPQIAALNIENLLAPGQTRRDFDTLLRQNAPSGTVTQYSGYLPFNMVDLWQQIRKDFAYVRVLTAALASKATASTDRALFERALRVRQSLTLRDIGMWAHFVGDASQPMHVSIHYNGWGDGPNPQNFSTAHIHAAFEGAFVKHFVRRDDILQHLAPYLSCEALTHVPHCPGIEGRVRVYLSRTLAQVTPLYALTKRAGGDDPWLNATPTAEQKSFVIARLVAGAQEMRDELVDAWRSAATISVGYPAIAVADIESGRHVYTATDFAAD